MVVVCAARSTGVLVTRATQSLGCQDETSYPPEGEASASSDFPEVGVEGRAVARHPLLNEATPAMSPKIPTQS